MNTFQLIVTGIFVVLIIAGVGIFSLFGGLGGNDDIGRVELWGTLDQASMQKVLTKLAEKDKTYQNIIYSAFPEATYQAELVNAIASGRGPDLFFVSEGSIGTLSDKLVPIPYSVISHGNYVSTYIDEALLFVAPQGLLAMPFSLDPLLMYWNRDLFTSAGIAEPPRYWSEFITLAPRMTSLESTQNVRRSAVALGSWDNIRNAKAVLSSLFMQSGDFVTVRGDSGNLVSIFGDKTNGSISPAEDALRFYTDFANPTKVTYSWNRSLPNSLQMFTSGDLAVYFGFASEYRSIGERNPNLRFSIGKLPQLQGSAVQITYGNITGLAVARSAQNPSGAVVAGQLLASKEASAALLSELGLPPVRRDSLPDTSGSAALSVVVQSALISRGWADPNKNATDTIFKTMIESVISGRSAPAQAVYEGASEFRQLLPNQ